MHLFGYVLAILASWSVLTCAAPPSAAGQSTSTQCYTRMDTSSGLWNTATTWSTRYKPCTTTLTSTATKTITPAPSTSTVTVSSTTTIVGPTSFSTVKKTTTTTKIINTTKTSTTTATTTTTSTVSTSTTTVAAPATFIPIQTSLPGSTYSGSGGTDPLNKRESQVAKHHGRGSQPGLCAPRYPKGVTCHHWTPDKCSTTTVTTTSSITATRKTVITTSTSTVTTTSIPSGTTTITSTATTTKINTITSTSTKTSTTTTTTYLTTTTVYAACATNNLADEYQGVPFLEVVGGFSTVADTTTDTAYDCCVAAVLLTNSTVWAFIPPTEGYNCFIGQNDGVCLDPSTTPSTAITDPTGNLVIGNSYCGEINAVVAAVTDPDPDS